MKTAVCLLILVLIAHGNLFAKVCRITVRYIQFVTDIVRKVRLFGDTLFEGQSSIRWASGAFEKAVFRLRKKTYFPPYFKVLIVPTARTCARRWPDREP